MRNMHKLWCVVAAACVLAAAPAAQAQTPRPAHIGKYTWEAFAEAGVPPEVAIWYVDMRTEGIPYYPPPNPLPPPLPATGTAYRFLGIGWNGMIGGEGGVPNDGTAPRGTLLWQKQPRGSEGYSFAFSNGPENLVRRQPQPQPQARPPAPAHIGPRTWQKFTDAGIPMEVARWLVDVQTEGVPYYPPPNPLPAPTGGGDFERQHGLPIWNGMIGGEGGVPDSGAAPRGTLLVCKGGGANAFSFANGPECLERRQVQPPLQGAPRRPTPVAPGVCPGGVCPGGVCPTGQLPLGQGTGFPVVLPQEATARRDERSFPVVLPQERQQERPPAVARR